MALPIVSVQLPSDLQGVTNGNLPSHLLTPVPGGGQLHHLAARAWNALCFAALVEAGLPLTFTHGGTYRSYAEQETLFRSRYAPNGPGGGCKTWNGVRWCKKSANLATAATPGTSNHGWGLAVDSAFDRDLSNGIGPNDATYIASHPGWQWLLNNAAKFGFSWELQSEPWHLRYVAGDNIPGAVLFLEAPSTAPEPLVKEVDMIAIRYNRTHPAYTAFAYTGTQLSHVTHPNVQGLLNKAGVVEVTVNDAELDELIKSSETTTSCPPEFVGTHREELWNKQRPR